MTKHQYRVLLIASIIISFVGGGVDFVFPQLVPDAFHQAQSMLDEDMSLARILVMIGLGSVTVIVSFVSFYGLYCFRPWAPRVSLVATALTLLFMPLAGIFVESGVAISLMFLSAYLWGAAVVLAHIEPFSAHFAQPNAR